MNSTRGFARATTQRASRRPLALWLYGLSAWVTSHTALAQGVPWFSWRAGGPYSRYDSGPSGQLHDPDLVRDGAFATVRASLAEGARSVERAAVDLDEDGVAERLLVVEPSRDPEPYLLAPGLVLAHHTPTGWRSFVVARMRYESGPGEHFNAGYVWGRVIRGRRVSVLIVDRHTEGRGCEAGEVVYQHRLQLSAQGEPLWVDGCAQGETLRATSYGLATDFNTPLPPWCR